MSDAFPDRHWDIDHYRQQYRAGIMVPDPLFYLEDTVMYLMVSCLVAEAKSQPETA